MVAEEPCSGRTATRGASRACGKELRSVEARYRGAVGHVSMILDAGLLSAPALCRINLAMGIYAPPNLAELSGKRIGEGDVHAKHVAVPLARQQGHLVARALVTGPRALNRPLPTVWLGHEREENV